MIVLTEAEIEPTVPFPTAILKISQPRMDAKYIFDDYKHTATSTSNLVFASMLLRSATPAAPEESMKALHVDVLDATQDTERESFGYIMKGTVLSRTLNSDRPVRAQKPPAAAQAPVKLPFGVVFQEALKSFIGIGRGGG